MSPGLKGGRWCRGCPFCAPRRRRRSDGFLGGLTMSDDGGLDELLESLLLPANCSWSLRTLSSASLSFRKTCARRRSNISTRCASSTHLGHSATCSSMPSTYPNYRLTPKSRYRERLQNSVTVHASTCGLRGSLAGC